MKHFRGWKELSPLEIDQVLARQPRKQAVTIPTVLKQRGKFCNEICWLSD